MTGEEGSKGRADTPEPWLYPDMVGPALFAL